jgi:hypothetical protein
MPEPEDSYITERPGEWAERVLKLAEKIAAQRRRGQREKADGTTSKSERYHEHSYSRT